jgi:hypothetical protein
MFLYNALWRRDKDISKHPYKARHANPDALGGTFIVASGANLLLKKL